MESRPQKRKGAVARGRGGPGKRRPLRGETLIRAALEALSRWTSLPPETHPINISRLAKELGVTRQALYDNGLGKAVDEHRALQTTKFSVLREAASQRKPLEERITSMEAELSELRRQRDGWIERWATVEYNARMLGIDADKIFAPMPPPDRIVVSIGCGRNGKDKDD